MPPLPGSGLLSCMDLLDTAQPGRVFAGVGGCGHNRQITRSVRCGIRQRPAHGGKMAGGRYLVGDFRQTRQ